MSFYPTLAEDASIEVTAPYKRRVGHEVEIEDYGQFCEAARRLGLGTPTRDGQSANIHRACDCYDCREADEGDEWTEGLHPYRCRCDLAQEFPIHTTYDDTAEGGEHIIGGTKGVLFASPAYMEAIDAVAKVAAESGSGGSSETGGHIHVSANGLTFPRSVKLFRNLTVVWNELSELAQGPWDEVRCNGCMEPPDTANYPLANISRSAPGQYRYGSYGEPPLDLWSDADVEAAQGLQVPNSAFRFHRSRTARTPDRPTIEFRLWNTTTSKWRLYMSAGVSSALVEAAVRGRELARDGSGSILEHLDGLLAPDVVALVQRQQAIVRGDVARAA